MRSFGAKSKKNLDTLHGDLAFLLTSFLRVSPCDFGILYGWRGEKIQNELYKQGRSNAKFGKSKHNHIEMGKPCSLAADIYPYIDGSYVVGKTQKEVCTIVSMMGALKEHARALGIKIRVGDDWDADGDLSDTNLFDAFHVELV